jgi:superfamily II DNA or RNA helicase
MAERVPLRWQQEVQARYLQELKRDFLLVAVPGAGKTFWAMHTARELIRNGRITRILIVAPTRYVKGQWARTAHELGLDIEFDYRSSDGAWPSDADGVVMTYSQMYEQPALHRMNVSRRPTLVVLDEVHHLEESAAWGRAAQEAFDMAAYRVHLSGTPWNTNGQIPWLRYEAGLAVPDSFYSYQDSLTHRVNCDVYFPKMGGRAEWDYDGERFTHTFEENLPEQDQRRRLRAFLNTSVSSYIPRTFQIAEDELSSIRQSGQDRAGGMIIAEDIPHAKAIASLIGRPGFRPVVVTSDDRAADELIKSFRNGTDRWIISVRMVSEGVDITRLRVLVYASAITTQLFFRQAVGRVIRGAEPPAVVFLPADPQLLKWATEFRKERAEAMRQAQELADASMEQGNGEVRPAGLFSPVRGEAVDAGVVHDESEISQAELERAMEMIRAAGSPADIRTAALFAKVLRSQPAQPEVPELMQEAPSAASPLKSERKNALRSIQAKLVTSYCRLHGQDYAMVNARLNEAVGVRRIRDCDEEQLRQRYELAKQWLI